MFRYVLTRGRMRGWKQSPIMENILGGRKGENKLFVEISLFCWYFSFLKQTRKTQNLFALWVR